MSKTAPIKPFNGKPTSSLQGTDISPAQAYKMTNYNERLDKILLSHGAEQGELHYSLKQALTALIKELVADAKPAHIHGTTASSGQFNRGVSEFEQNLLKELEEV